MRKSEPSINGYRNWVKRRGLIERCERCGYDTVTGILVIHHRDHHRSNNHPSNLAILCPNCHASEHYGSNDAAS